MARELNEAPDFALPSHEWYKPTLEEMSKLPPGSRAFAKLGGLLIRSIE
jgi:hypothetical protein